MLFSNNYQFPACPSPLELEGHLAGCRSPPWGICLQRAAQGGAFDNFVKNKELYISTSEPFINGTQYSLVFRFISQLKLSLNSVCSQFNSLLRLSSFWEKSLHVLTTIFGHTIECCKLRGWGSVKTLVHFVKTQVCFKNIKGINP